MPTLRCSRRRRYLFLHLHEAGAAFLAHFVRELAVERVGGGALHRRVGKAADAVEFGFAQEIKQVLELRLGLARETGDEGASGS